MCESSMKSKGPSGERRWDKKGIKLNEKGDKRPVRWNRGTPKGAELKRLNVYSEQKGHTLFFIGTPRDTDTRTHSHTCSRGKDRYTHWYHREERIRSIYTYTHTHHGQRCRSINTHTYRCHPCYLKRGQSMLTHWYTCTNQLLRFTLSSVSPFLIHSPLLVSLSVSTPILLNLLQHPSLVVSPLLTEHFPSM